MRVNAALETRLGIHHGFRGQVCNLDYSELLTAASEGQ